MEWESDSSCCSHTYPRQGHTSPGRLSGWELEFRDYGAISRWGPLLTAERWIEGMWGKRLWWEMPVEESRAATKARLYCWVRGGAITIASLSLYTSINSWIIESLAHQTPDAQNYRVGHPGCSFKWLMCQTQSRTPAWAPIYVPDILNNREGPQASAWTGRAPEKDWPKRPSDHQLQEAWKKTLIGQ